MEAWLNMQLFPFQEYGADWLSSRTRAYLGDVMGLGKTAQAIVGACRAGAKRVLVICPASMVGTWHIEIDAWAEPLLPAWMVVSYDMIVRNENAHADVLNFEADTIICDEAHYLKGLETKRTEYVLEEIACGVPRVWLLSGTPTPNGPHELWTVMRNLFPEWLSTFGIQSYTGWLDHFCNWWQGEYGPIVKGAKNIPDLRKLLFSAEGIMLRRTFDEVGIQLPELDLRQFPLQMRPQDKDAYAMMEELLPPEVWDALDAGELPPDDAHMATIRRLLGECKAKLLVPVLRGELVEDPAHKVVIFAYHRKTLDMLQEGLQTFGLVRLDGSTPQKARTQMVSTFQKQESCRVFLAQIVAGGVGVTLTAAKDVVIVEPQWTPGDNLQAIARVRRIGQRAGTVTARLVVLKGTLDDPIMGVIRRKMLTLKQTIGG